MEKIQKAWDSCFYCIFALIFVLILGASGGMENINADVFLYKILDSMGIVAILCVTLLWVLINGGLWTYCTEHGIKSKPVLLIYIILNIMLLIMELVTYSFVVLDEQEILLYELQSIKFSVMLLMFILSVVGVILGIQLRKNLLSFKNSIGCVFISVYTIPFLSFLVESLLLGTTQISVLLTAFVWICSLSVLFLFFLGGKYLQ